MIGSKSRSRHIGDSPRARSSLRLLLSGQCDQHWIGKRIDSDLTHHVDDLGGRVLGVDADMKMHVCSGRSVPFAQTGAGADLVDDLVK